MIQHAADAEQSNRAEARAAELVAEQLRAVGWRVDRLFAWVLILEWLAAIAGIALVSPSTGLQSPPVITWVIVGGAFVSGIPLGLMWCIPGRPLTRHAVAVALIIWSTLLMEHTGGRLGSHFPVFGALAILACYRDWRILLTATATYIGRDILRADLWPFDSQAAIYEWERLGFILFEVCALVLAIRLSDRETWLFSIGQARIEESNRRLELQYRERTANYRDYTERLERVRDELHRQASELQQARAAAEEANAAKSHLVATVSHEIRTPLTAILGYADVLVSNLIDGESIKAARTIKRNSEFLLQLVDDILDLSRIESGKLAVEMLRCSPRQIVGEVVQLLQVRADAKGLPLVVECGDDVPETIHSDPLRLRQILLNLVSNAIKFSSRGEVRIRMLSNGPAGDPCMRFEIRDQGIGLTPRQIENLFHPFAQGDETTSRLFGGSGLGLWISKQLANLLGGDIAVQSEPGKGSNFVVTVGINQPQTDVAPAWTASAVADETQAAGVSDLENCRILVAEDSPDNQELVTFVLERSGAQVTAVDNGAEAVRVALAAQRNGSPFDVILMDVQMPMLDGFTATERLREQEYPGLIVALTAHARPEELQQSRRSGCNACISKPIDNSILRLIAQLKQRAGEDNRTLTA